MIGPPHPRRRYAELRAETPDELQTCTRCHYLKSIKAFMNCHQWCMTCEAAVHAKGSKGLPRPGKLWICKTARINKRRRRQQQQEGGQPR